MAIDEYVLDKAVYLSYQEDLLIDQVRESKKEEFNTLVKRAIKNELRKDDATILQMYFFWGYSQAEIARMFNCNRSTICKRINKSLDTLYEKLKYAAEYRFGVTLVKEGAEG